MNAATPKQPSSEFPFQAWSGLAMLVGQIAGLVLALTGLAFAIKGQNPGLIALILFFAIPSTILTLSGFFIVRPNSSCILVLLGKYRGTVRKEGFYWANPFTSKHKMSLRAYNLASETIKVNDLYGNPIEIGAVVVWQVEDTAKANFDVEDYEDYVAVQIETAVRELAKTHPYENHTSDGDAPQVEERISLRSSTDQISKELTAELQTRLERAGIMVLEARISHLAYAVEIASAMLQRQQAAAIISARRLIVEGAVGMVEQALGDLQKRGVVDLDDELKATMVSNLLVVLCSQSAANPVINTGGIYN